MTASRCPAASWMRCGVLDDLGVRQLARAVLAEQLGEADDRVERRPELVAHVGDELGLDLAGELGLDAGRLLGRARAMAQHGLAQQSGVLLHQACSIGRFALNSGS